MEKGKIERKEKIVGEREKVGERGGWGRERGIYIWRDEDGVRRSFSERG